LARRHELPPLEPDEFPKIGYIVNNVAAGFLLHSEMKSIAFLDGFLVNPESGLRDRHRAICWLTATLLAHAEVLHLKTLGALTQSHGIEKIAKRFGFERKGEYIAIEKQMDKPKEKDEW